MTDPTHYSVFVDTTLPLVGLAVHAIENESDDELRVEESGALRIFDLSGESFIYAPGVWTSVKVRPEGGVTDA